MPKAQNAFEVADQRAKLNNVNPRMELHGDEKRLAADLSLHFKLDNDALAMIHPSLKSMLYMKGDNSAQADMLNGKDDLRALRIPDLGSLKFGKEQTGCSVVIPYGIDAKTAIKLDGVTVDKFVVDAAEGGTVEIGCRAIIHCDEMTMGRLCGMQQQDIEISITAPGVEGE